MVQNAQKTLTIAHWVMNLSANAGSSVESWVDYVRTEAQKAADAGADILLMPEHNTEQWMTFCPPETPLTAELDWIAAQAAVAVPALRRVAEEVGIAIVTGSSAWRHEETGRFRNRTWMVFPDRDPVYHDKLVLTPSECDPAGWSFERGNEIKVFTWRGVRFGLIICLDVEMPALGHLLAEQDIDLLLVPSMTTKVAGYHRVFSCARARAVELMTAVAVVGCVGGAPGREAFNGGAAVYIPSEEMFGHTGIFSDLPVHDSDTGVGKILMSRDIPVMAIRDVRHGVPEAWPGPFAVDHIKVKTEA